MQRQYKHNRDKKCLRGSLRSVPFLPKLWYDMIPSVCRDIGGRPNSNSMIKFYPNFIQILIRIQYYAYVTFRSHGFLLSAEVMTVTDWFCNLNFKQISMISIRDT